MKTSKIKLQDIILDAVVDENPNFTATVTQKPVETGQDISDYMKQRPLIIHLSGHCVKDAASKHERLRNYQKEKKLLKYIGRGVYSNAVITELNTRHNTNNAFGFDFDITLTCIRIAKPESFEIKTKDPDGKNDAKAQTKVRTKTKVGRQQPQKQSGKPITKKSAHNSKSTGTNKLVNADDHFSIGDELQRASQYALVKNTKFIQAEPNKLKDKYMSHIKHRDNQRTPYQLGSAKAGGRR